VKTNGGEEKLQEGVGRRRTVIATSIGPFSLFHGITKCETLQIRKSRDGYFYCQRFAIRIVISGISKRIIIIIFVNPTFNFVSNKLVYTCNILSLCGVKYSLGVNLRLSCSLSYA